MNLDNVIIEFKDKKNSSATIKNGQIILRISNRISKKTQQQHIEHLLNRFKKHQLNTQIQLHTGELVNFYGIKRLWLNIETTAKKTTSIKLDPTAPFLNIKHPELDQANLRTKITAKITSILKPELLKLVNKINNETVNQQINKIEFKNFQSRWGHCAFKQKTIALSTKLAWVPFECFEYVIIHELCHLIHPNHSRNFWNLVKKYCPNYKSIQKELHRYQ